MESFRIGKASVKIMTVATVDAPLNMDTVIKLVASVYKSVKLQQRLRTKGEFKTGTGGSSVKMDGIAKNARTS